MSGRDSVSGVTRQIFVVGMNGSGTTMLLDHLANHSAIFGFWDETKMLPYFINTESRYGDLGRQANFESLWNDLATAVVGDPKKAGALQWPAESERSVAAAFDLLMRQLASAQGKRIWCEKTPMYVHHLELLGRHFPDARFIHVIRDGRNSAASFHRRWKFNPLRTIHRWKNAVRAGQEQGKQLGSRYYEARYEQITESPEAAFREMLDFLGLPFEPDVLSIGRSRPNSTTPSHGKVERNERSAASYFDRALIAEMESMAGRLLTELGYECANPAGEREPNRLQLRWWQISDDVRRFGTFVTRNGRMLRPSKWRYIAGRIRNSLRQKASL